MDDTTEILQRMTAIETELRMIRTNGLPSCALHTSQIASLQKDLSDIKTVVGRHGVVVMAFTAIGIGLGLSFKYLVGLGAR